MFLGIDTSVYLEQKRRGAVYFDGDTPVDPLDLFRANGVECMRIRLWVNPASESGEPYMAGNCDLEHFFELASLARSKGYSIMLDFHYSDFWTDPAKQTIPKGWEKNDIEKLCRQVYDYTVKTLAAIKAKNIPLAYIQVGNEITNGMLWPLGLLKESGGAVREGYPNLIKLLKSGIKACREIVPETALILHLERSFDQAVYDEFFTQMQTADVDYDIIGYSYYPQWHGTFDMFFANVDMCKKFGKRQMAVEVSYAFTLKDYLAVDTAHTELALGENNIGIIPYKLEFPTTPEGQAEFTKKFIALCKKHGVESAFWWEPLWTPVNGNGWASVDAQKYIGIEPKYTRNEWANQCLFDYRGRKLPAFDAYKL